MNVRALDKATRERMSVLLYAIVVLLILIADQGMKYWTMLNIVEGEPARVFIPGILGLERVHNYGAAFSILENMRWPLVALAAICSVVIVVFLALRKIQGRAGRWFAVLILAGALGNAIDRAVLGYVVDMFTFLFFRFPTFNIADIFVVCGGVAFCLYVIFHKEYAEEVEAPAARRAPTPVKRPEPNKKAPAKSKASETLKKREDEPHVADIESIDLQSIKRSAASRAKPNNRRRPEAASGGAAEDSRMQRYQAQLEERIAAAEASQNTNASSADIVEFPAKPQPRPEPRTTPKPQTNEAEFTLEDILAEFSDNY